MSDTYLSSISSDSEDNEEVTQIRTSYDVEYDPPLLTKFVRLKLRKWRESAKTLVQNVLKSKKFSPFHFPVDLEKYPDYRLYIKQPMDLSTILQKLNDDYYLSSFQFANDVDLIYRNSRCYNTKKKSKIYELTTEFDELVLKAALKIEKKARHRGYKYLDKHQLVEKFEFLELQCKKSCNDTENNQNDIQEHKENKKVSSENTEKAIIIGSEKHKKVEKSGKKRERKKLLKNFVKDTKAEEKKTVNSKSTLATQEGGKEILSKESVLKKQESDLVNISIDNNDSVIDSVNLNQHFKPNSCEAKEKIQKPIKDIDFHFELDGNQTEVKQQGNFKVLKYQPASDSYLANEKQQKNSMYFNCFSKAKVHEAQVNKEIVIVDHHSESDKFNKQKHRRNLIYEIESSIQRDLKQLKDDKVLNFEKVTCSFLVKERKLKDVETLNYESKLEASEIRENRNLKQKHVKIQEYTSSNCGLNIHQQKKEIQQNGLEDENYHLKLNLKPSQENKRKPQKCGTVSNPNVSILKDKKINPIDVNDLNYSESNIHERPDKENAQKRVKNVCNQIQSKSNRHQGEKNKKKTKHKILKWYSEATAHQTYGKQMQQNEVVTLLQQSEAYVKQTQEQRDKILKDAKKQFKSDKHQTQELVNEGKKDVNDQFESDNYQMRKQRNKKQKNFKKHFESDKYQTEEHGNKMQIEVQDHLESNKHQRQEQVDEKQNDVNYQFESNHYQTEQLTEKKQNDVQDQYKSDKYQTKKQVNAKQKDLNYQFESGKYQTEQQRNKKQKDIKYLFQSNKFEIEEQRNKKQIDVQDQFESDKYEIQEQRNKKQTDVKVLFESDKYETLQQRKEKQKDLKDQFECDNYQSLQKERKNTSNKSLSNSTVHHIYEEEKERKQILISSIIQDLENEIQEKYVKAFKGDLGLSRCKTQIKAINRTSSKDTNDQSDSYGTQMQAKKKETPANNLRHLPDLNVHLAKKIEKLQNNNNLTPVSKSTLNEVQKERKQEKVVKSSSPLKQEKEKKKTKDKLLNHQTGFVTLNPDPSSKVHQAQKKKKVNLKSSMKDKVNKKRVMIDVISTTPARNLGITEGHSYRSSPSLLKTTAVKKFLEDVEIDDLSLTPCRQLSENSVYDSHSCHPVFKKLKIS